MKKANAIIFSLGALLSSFEVSAHLLEGEQFGLTEGFLHPLVGFDHLLAMTGIGFWLGMQDESYSYRMLGLLLFSLILGAILAVLPASTFWLEPGLSSSVILLGLLIAGRFPRSVGYSLSIAAGFLHGYAHGLEIPATVSALNYGFGFLTATAGLQAMGWIVGSKVRHAPIIPRMLGALMMVTGAHMLIG